MCEEQKSQITWRGVQKLRMKRKNEENRANLDKWRNTYLTNVSVLSSLEQLAMLRQEYSWHEYSHKNNKYWHVTPDALNIY